MSVAQQVTYAATTLFSILLWSWGCGFVLSSLSGRAFWITSFLFYCAVRDVWAIRLALAGNVVLKQGIWITMLYRLLPVEPILVVFLLALAFGVRSARKGTLQPKTGLCITAVGLASVLLPTWMDTWFSAGFAHWSGQPYHPTSFVYRVLPWLAGAWPVFSVPLLHESGGNSTASGMRRQPFQDQFSLLLERTADFMRNPRLKILLLALSCAVFATCAMAATAQAALKRPGARMQAPSFRLMDGLGRTEQLTDYRGKVVLLNFWATDCGGCRLEIPWLVDIDKTFQNKSVAVIGISMDISYEDLKNATEAWAKVKPFVALHKITYPILYGGQRRDETL